MASETDVDIFTRSLSGDRRARTELFKKFLRDSSRVRRLGVGYPDADEFLHDSFSNVLRTGHGWNKSDDVANWVEGVARWTALQYQRGRDIAARDAKGDSIRMCAEIDGDDGGKSFLKTYAPPAAGVEDSPRARLEAILPDPDCVVLIGRAVDQTNWEELAASLGKPVHTVGPMFTRAAAKLARLFGAPPPIDDDFVPVFERAAEDPQTPEGRSISILADNSFYNLTPEMRRIGLTTSSDARMLVLWEAAVSEQQPGETLRAHFNHCPYCSDLLHALALLKKALVAGPGAPFLLCPGSYALASSVNEQRQAVETHVAECAVCRSERDSLQAGGAPRAAEGADDSDARAGAGKRMAIALGVLTVLGAAGFGGFQYFESRKKNAEKTAAVLPEVEQQSVARDPRYADLVRDVGFDQEKIMKSVLPQNRPIVKWAIDKISLGQFEEPLVVCQQVNEKTPDPGVQMTYAMCLYRMGLASDGYRAMLKSEQATPRQTFRCWIMFQFALLVADQKIIDREAQHLAGDPDFGDGAAKIMDKVRAR